MTQQSTPPLRTDPNNVFIQDSYNERAFRGQYTGTNLIYRGYAIAGSATSQAVWQIAFLTYDGSNNLLSVQWPLTGTNASTGFDFIWDNRATYTYA